MPVRIDAYGTSANIAGVNQLFDIGSNGDGTVSYKNPGTAGYLVSENGGTQPLKANRGAIGGWEKFTLVPQ